jgi:hypothetical protein
MRIRQLLSISLLMMGLGGSHALAEEPNGSFEDKGTGDLAKQSQNPVSDLISVPFQNNTNFQQGRYNQTGNILNIQPVIPVKLSDDWNLISRTIIPIDRPVALNKPIWSLSSSDKCE